jgi:hypothetical protein
VAVSGPLALFDEGAGRALRAAALDDRPALERRSRAMTAGASLGS